MNDVFAVIFIDKHDGILFEKPVIYIYMLCVNFKEVSSDISLKSELVKKLN